MLPTFIKKAKEAERVFLKRCQFYLTLGEKRKNTITRYTNKTIYIKTEVGSKEFAIPRSKVREALRFLFMKRTVTRKDLQRFRNYTSAMIAILHMVVADISRVSKLPSGLIRLTLKGVRFWFSGCCRGKGDIELIKKHGGTGVLVNYAYLRTDKTQRFRTYLQGILAYLDSGGFQGLQKEGSGGAPKRKKKIPPIDVIQYGEFVKDNIDLFQGYFNLDIGGREKARENMETLTRITGSRPIPVWHYDWEDAWEELDRIVKEEHDVVAIGKTAKISEPKRLAIYTEVFKRYPDQPFHILGLASKLLFSLSNIFSSDAGSWLKGRKLGKKKRQIITPMGQLDVPMTMPAEECIAQSIRYLSSLEEAYEGLQHDSLYWQMKKERQSRKKAADEHDQLSFSFV